MRWRPPRCQNKHFFLRLRRGGGGVVIWYLFLQMPLVCEVGITILCHCRQHKSEKIPLGAVTTVTRLIPSLFCSSQTLFRVLGLLAAFTHLSPLLVESLISSASAVMRESLQLHFWAISKNSSYVSGVSVCIFVALYLCILVSWYVRMFVARANKVEGTMSWCLGTNETLASI